MQRSTKIVATLGPASSSPEVVSAMVAAGVDVVRMNFSHGTREEHLARAQLVREAAHGLGRTIGVMCDLQGPKIRIGKFESGKIVLKKGDTFVLDAECKMGDRERVGLDYRELTKDVRAGDVLLLDDGRLVLDVRKVIGPEIQTIVRVGGELSNNKGINRQGGGLTAPALTAKDMQDIRTAVEMKADFLAVSFPKSGADMYMARELMRAAGGHAMIIAKMERAEAVQAMDELLTAREHNKLTITATQMMESMITSPVPTRAEVSDVANAVLDGTDAVMLSAETASGSYPVETVEAMARICIEAEKSDEVTLDRHFLDRVFTRVDQSIAMAALFTAYHLKVKAIAALTQSGSTALWISRLNSGVPIYALTPETMTRYRMSLFRDVFPMMVDYRGHELDVMLQEAEDNLVNAGVVEKGDLIVVTFGEPIGTSGGTNTMKIVRVGEARRP
jgi:pyruvate kinase